MLCRRRHNTHLLRELEAIACQPGQGWAAGMAALLIEAKWAVQRAVAASTDRLDPRRLDHYRARYQAIIAEHWTVPEQVRRRRRSRKGKAPQQVHTGHVTGAQSATRRPSPSPASLGRHARRVKPAQPHP